MDRRLFLGAAGGLALARPAHAQLFGRGSSGPAAIAIGSREDGLAKATGLFNRTARSVVPAGSKVIAPFFTVEIVEELGRTVASRGVGGGNQATSKFTIEGLDDAAIQSAVDRLYPQILTNLTSAGYTIITREEARANAEFAKLLAIEKPPMWQSNTAGGGKSKFFAPTGMGPYFTPGDARFGTFSAFGISTSHVMAEVNSPVQLSAILMGIELGVRFVDVQTSGGGQYDALFGSNAVSIRGGRAAMTLDPDRTRIWFKLPLIRDERNFLSINRPVGPTLNPVIGSEDITSNKSKATDIAASLISGLGGAGRSYQTRNYRITLNPQAFPLALESLGVGLTAAMISQVSVTGPVVRPR
jgi:hypothetical protein